MNPQEVSTYKTLIAIQHMIEDANDHNDNSNYEYFRSTFNATQEGVERLMRDIGRRHLIEADFLIDKCDHL